MLQVRCKTLSRDHGESEQSLFVTTSWTFYTKPETVSCHHLPGGWWLVTRLRRDNLHCARLGWGVGGDDRLLRGTRIITLHVWRVQIVQIVPIVQIVQIVQIVHIIQIVQQHLTTLPRFSTNTALEARECQWFSTQMCKQEFRKYCIFCKEHLR